MDKRTLKKRNATTAKRWGWALAGLSLLMLVPTENYTFAESVAYGMVFLVPGAFLLIRSYINTRKWDMLESRVNNFGNTSIPEIAAAVGKPESFVRSNLQDMINRGFFSHSGCSAYIDGALDMFVVTRDGRPIDSLEAASKAQAAKAEERKQSVYIRQIRQTIALIEDEHIVEVLRALEKSIKKIENTIYEKPQLNEDRTVVKMREDYMPDVMNLVEKLKSDTFTDETKRKICESLETCTKAFNNINKQLNETDNIMTQVDIDVLKSELASEGYLDPDFDIK